ncbi:MULTISPECIES: NAD(+)/NADH kinase [Haloferax]|uniref:ATP-NAD kinase n=1 Tax=Haloferax marinum TaxID=2666143 RepID=A0A6A8G413_9EURY|nr:MULTISPECIES: NAD(+)/NADH kinase [Haloferax]KAB1196936.1 ATP-NAD kinase [Haloferax sp. CBA1150]MRW95954.1 ATP-NAD kinase [Haloferax marinum]
MRFAVVGDESVGTAIREAGGSVVSPDEEPSADAVVAVGESSVADAVFDSAFDCPVFPVDCGAPWSVPRRELTDAISSVTAGDGRLFEHPILSVTVGGDQVGRALFDTMLITSEPARISEYGVAHVGPEAPVDTPTDESDDDWVSVDEFRADGVVVATPLGSTGYARAAGGSVVGPNAGVAVVPVSPYATRTDTWVFQPPLRLTVERDDTPVSLVVDDGVVCDVSPSDPVYVTVDGTATLLSR